MIMIGDIMKDLSFFKEYKIAHRGVHNNKIPENSLSAFKKAIRENYIIELDVHLLKDNNIIVFHDDDLKRMCNVNKKVKDLTLDEIEKYNLKNTKEKIPTLKEVLKLIDGKVPVIIELKDDLKYGALQKELIKQLDNYKGLFAVKSFNPFAVYWFKKHRKNYIRGLLVLGNYKNLPEYIIYKMYLLKLCNPDFLSCNYNLYNNKKVLKFKQKKPVLAWTINTQNSYNKYVDKFDNLICNNTEGLKWKN